ncbi:MAG TPA: hypothetical protein PLV42_12960, partial [bacterium]|nr:hypothetical protein [bacterium]
APEKKEERRLDPLSSTQNRELFYLIEKLSLALRLESIPVFFDPALKANLAIEHANLPVLAIGKSAESADRKKMAFMIAANLFLCQNGVTEKLGRKGSELLADQIGATIALSGKERTAFIRGLKKKSQEEMASALDELGSVPEPALRDFAERLHLASVLYAFSVIPDPAQVAAIADETIDHLDVPNSLSRNAFDLALATFFG